MLVASEPFPRCRAHTGKEERGTCSASHRWLGKQTHPRQAAYAMRKAEFTFLPMASSPGSILLATKETSWDTSRNL